MTDADNPYTEYQDTLPFPAPFSGLGEFPPYLGNLFQQGQTMNKDDRRDFTEVRVHKNKLLTQLKANRTAHIAAFEEGMAGWREEIDNLSDKLSAAHGDGADAEKLRKLARAIYNEQPPQSHEEDYDHIIELLEASEDKEFVISSRDFARYFRDQWDWKDQFTNSTSKYR